MKRVIFGGSFDPLTLAHYDMGEKLSRDFDEVIVVPLTFRRSRSAKWN